MFRNEKLLKLFLGLAVVTFGMLSEREHKLHPYDGGYMLFWGVLSIICIIILVIIEWSDR